MKMHKGVWVREGTYDSYVVNEIERCYGQLDVKDKVVFDIGANIGAFTVWALEHGAAHVYSYEPLPENFRMLQKNCNDRPNCSLHEAAIDVGYGGTVLFFVPGGKNPGNTSTKIQRGRQGLPVDTYGFKRELASCHPSVLKVDVEGAEYDWLQGDTLPSYVKQVAVEIHLTKKNWRDVHAPALVNSFKKWRCVRKPKLDGKNWQTMGVWKR